MRTREFRLSKETLRLTGVAVGISSLIEGIRSSPSENPEALPLRGGKGEPLPSWAGDPDSREINRKHYSKLKKSFLSDQLKLTKNFGAGLYFFVGPGPQYYYIGISDNLHRRIGEEHLRRRDFINYAIAFPHNFDTYLQEALSFYSSKPQYRKFAPLYKREFSCLREKPFDRIAWIAIRGADYSLIEDLETNFVSFESPYKPCCNIEKSGSTLRTECIEQFRLVERFLKELTE